VEDTEASVQTQAEVIAQAAELLTQVPLEHRAPDPKAQEEPAIHLDFATGEPELTDNDKALQRNMGPLVPRPPSADGCLRRRYSGVSATRARVPPSSASPTLCLSGLRSAAEKEQPVEEALHSQPEACVQVKDGTRPSSGTTQKKSVRPMSSAIKKQPAILEHDVIQHRPRRLHELVQMSSEAAKRCAAHSDENTASPVNEEGTSSPSQHSVWRQTAQRGMLSTTKSLEDKGMLSTSKTAKVKSQPVRTKQAKAAATLVHDKRKSRPHTVTECSGFSDLARNNEVAEDTAIGALNQSKKHPGMRYVIDDFMTY